MSATVIQMRRKEPPAVVPPLNVHAYVHTILEAANSLLRDELEIIAFNADISTHKPVIWVNDCPRVRNLARVGQASYQRQGHSADGPYQVGVFERCGVSVQWMERVTP